MEGRDPYSHWRGELWRMADLITPMALRVVATLGIAGHIARGIQTAPDLAEATGTNADTLDRVLRHLTTVGVFRRDEAGRYALHPLAKALAEEGPDGIAAQLDIESAIGRADLCFVQLLHSVRTGEPAFPVHFGRSFWDDLAADPVRSASFDVQMGVDVSRDAPDIVPGYDWGALGHVVDIGGGNGALLVALLRAFPTLRGTVVDLPRTAEAARRAFEDAGLQDRADAVAGSFFDPLPPGAGGYLLSAIIHDWDDEPARAILRRCAEAAGEQGHVFIVEKIGSDGESLRTEMDLRMLAYFAGAERGVTELTALAETAGLQLVAVHPAGALSILELAAR